MARWNVIKAFSLGACGVFACSGAPNLDLGTTQAPIVLPVGSDEGSLWVKTIPTASCVLASSEPTSDSASLRFATDEEGIAEIGSLARPTSAT
jgi:hypothetical protein